MYATIIGVRLYKIHPTNWVAWYISGDCTYTLCPICVNSCIDIYQKNIWRFCSVQCHGWCVTCPWNASFNVKAGQFTIYMGTGYRQMILSDGVHNFCNLSPISVCTWVMLPPNIVRSFTYLGCTNLSCTSEIVSLECAVISAYTKWYELRLLLLCDIKIWHNLILTIFNS